MDSIHPQETFFLGYNSDLIFCKTDRPLQFVQFYLRFPFRVSTIFDIQDNLVENELFVVIRLIVEVEMQMSKLSIQKFYFYNFSLFYPIQNNKFLMS